MTITENTPAGHMDCRGIFIFQPGAVSKKIPRLAIDIAFGGSNVRLIIGKEVKDEGFFGF
ncbi:MAG TPA: hypothetical protein VN521_09135 [Negativicutes bacterium]|nr:hypothetical protein [Negativicutes bacterium]